MSHEVDGAVKAEQDQALADTDKVLVIVTTAATDRVYAALVLAYGARLGGKACDLMFTASAITAICTSCMGDLSLTVAAEPGRRVAEDVIVAPHADALATHFMHEGLAGLGLPAVEKLLQMFKDVGGYVYASTSAVDEMQLSRADLWDGVKDTLAVSAFYHHATPGTQIIFM